MLPKTFKLGKWNKTDCVSISYQRLFLSKRRALITNKPLPYSPLFQTKRIRNWTFRNDFNSPCSDWLNVNDVIETCVLIFCIRKLMNTSSLILSLPQFRQWRRMPKRRVVVSVNTPVDSNTASKLNYNGRQWYVHDILEFL